MKVLKKHKSFGGIVSFCEHDSRHTKTTMKISTFVPAGASRGCVIWLSGLTCTEENFMAKAGAQQHLAKSGLAVICPDTSPRGLSLPGEHESYDFGSGAGFYVDALADGYRDHYKMFSYVDEEIYGLAETEFNSKGRISIMGHSMGGHGALVIGLRGGAKYKSISAFSPIVNPSACPWGQKALTGYLGDDRTLWKKYDACELIASGAGANVPILVDQGAADEFLEKQLLTERLVEISKTRKLSAEIRMQDGYDHSYYFISTFIGDHVRFHSSHLG